ncbi:MAG: hypothetical protein B6I20_07570 [Bacteroidetes bacterium 4572_117]|nr:MAG: hypothetical protein B6I20_07570 [Bacteroidetes bacterium 4572_117]
MVIVNNQLQVAKIKLAFIIFFFVGLGLLVPFFVSQFITTEHYMMLIIGLMFLLSVLFLVIIKPEHIHMVEFKNSLQIKNYPARPILRQYKAFEIKLNLLHHFEIHKSFFNKKVTLTIWVKTKKGVGNYPPLSLSALSKNEQSKLIKYLNQHSIDKKKNIIPS